MAAPTISASGTTIEMTFTDSTTDFIYGTTAFTAELEGLHIKSIIFEPSGADTMVIREGSIAGPALMRVSCVDSNAQKVLYFGERGSLMKPCIDATDITLTTPANAKLIFNIA